MEDKQESPAVPEPADCAAEVCERGRMVAAGRNRKFGVGQPENRPPAAAADLSALVGDNAKKPRLHLCARPDLAELPPGLEGSLLDGVLGSVRIVEHGAGKPIRRKDEGAQQSGERSLVTGLRLGDQVTIQSALYDFR